jgi:DNA-binding GntR family transcriptional regulator
MARRAARIGRSLAASGLAVAANRVVSHPDAHPIPLRRNTISSQIHAALRRDIIVGRLAPRAMLSEQEFAVQFGISRTPVREAMIKLAEEGLVEIFPQYGSFVAPIKLLDVFDSQFAREALECASVERAIERLDKSGDGELKAVIDRQRSSLRPRSRDAFFRADEDMHILIFKLAGHANAWRFVEGAKAQMDRVRHIAITLPRKQASILAEHEAVIDRMRARDRRGAVEAMRVHLRGIFRTIEMLRNENSAYFADEQHAETARVAAPQIPRQTRKYVNSISSNTRT